MLESIDDLTAPWMGAGIELATRMLALADEMDGEWRELAAGRAAESIRDVVKCEYNPLPPSLPPLGDPPTLRSAVPPNSHPGNGVQPEAGS
jgi:hypothetical protein